MGYYFSAFSVSYDSSWFAVYKMGYRIVVWPMVGARARNVCLTALTERFLNVRMYIHVCLTVLVERCLPQQIMGEGSQGECMQCI